MQIEPMTNFWRVEIRKSKDFNPDSFVTINAGGKLPKGMRSMYNPVLIIFGKLKNDASGTLKKQSYMFPFDRFPKEKDVSRWLRKQRIELTNPSDWDNLKSAHAPKKIGDSYIVDKNSEGIEQPVLEGYSVLANPRGLSADSFIKEAKKYYFAGEENSFTDKLKAYENFLMAYALVEVAASMKFAGYGQTKESIKKGERIEKTDKDNPKNYIKRIDTAATRLRDVIGMKLMQLKSQLLSEARGAQGKEDIQKKIASIEKSIYSKEIGQYSLF